ncbi:MAG: hypothetical protein AAGJ86_02225 [Pseudomonadota bacterium]
MSTSREIRRPEDSTTNDSHLHSTMPTGVFLLRLNVEEPFVMVQSADRLVLFRGVECVGRVRHAHGFATPDRRGGGCNAAFACVYAVAVSAHACPDRKDIVKVYLRDQDPLCAIASFLI